MASIYLRGKIWWICYLDKGRKIDQSLKTRDKTVAKFKKNQIENRLAIGDSPMPDKSVTVWQAFEDFKRSRKGRIVLKTETTDNYRIDLFLKETGVKRLSSINDKLVKDNLDQRIKADDGISHRTANHTIRILKTFLNWAVESKLINHNPIAKMKRYKINETEPRFLNDDEIMKVLEASRKSIIYPLMVTAIYTGMRFSEMERLEWEDIDFKEKIITVRLSKSEKFRKIPLHSELDKVLSPMRGKGKCLRTKAYTAHFKRIRAAAGIGHFRFHDLRHTFASIMIKSGVDIYTVSKLLGHSNVVTTQIYSHLYRDHLHDAMGKFPAFIPAEKK